jgi:Domain of unknown function (DUF4352)
LSAQGYVFVFIRIRDNVPIMRFRFPLLAIALVASGTSCKDKAPTAEIGTFGMGERAQVGPLIYTVVDSQWAISLGEGVTARVPANRYLMINLTVVNSGKDPVSVPAFTLVDDGGTVYTELDNGEGVQNWMGVLRKVAPAESSQGVVLFDVPQKQFRMRLADDTDTKYALITIPLVLGDPVVTRPVDAPPQPRSLKP